MEDEVFAYVIEFVLNCACFTYIGAWLPFAQFDLPDLGVDLWRLIALFVGILLLRRIPCLLAVYKWIPDVKTWREALFCGHFGGLIPTVPFGRVYIM
jgi:NhaP-type Na+/H+ or K+/H+ antiporter